MDAITAADLACNVHGWMDHTDLKWLYSKAESLPKGSIIVELGCWLGRSMTAMALGHPYPDDLWVIDTFKGTPTEPDG